MGITSKSPIKNFNKVINLKIKNNFGAEVITITCPTYGRKPNIEITGSFTTSECVPEFDITVKNIYFDLSGGKSYTVEVTLGYINGKCEALVGTLVYLYQSTPGPESTTVIHCTQGALADKWIKNPAKVNLSEGYTLKQVITEINDALEYETEPLIADEVASLTDKQPLEYDGSVLSLISNIKKRFDVYIITRNDRLVVYPVGKSSGLVSHTVNYLSSPPLIQGGEATVNYVEITCPYDPDIKPGDEVTFYSSYYRTKLNVSNSSTKTTIAVNNVQFHFGTVSSANQMTIAGNVLKGGNNG